MADTVLLEAFSGEELFSSREVDIEEYYDGDVPEIDDREFNVKNKISRLRITTPSMNKVDYNFYNSSGKPVKFITFENGRLTRAELCGESDELFRFLQISYIAHDKPFVEVYYALSGGIKDFSVIGGYTDGEGKNRLFEKHFRVLFKKSGSKKIPLEGYLPEGSRFYAAAVCGGRAYRLDKSAKGEPVKKTIRTYERKINMKKIFESTVTVKELLVNFGVASVASAIIKALRRDKDMSIPVYALQMTAAWVLGKVIAEGIDAAVNQKAVCDCCGDMEDDIDDE